MGSPQVINCTLSTVSGVESSSVMISWMGPRGNITSGSRVTISSTTSNGIIYTNSLQFSYLMEGDKGAYTCNVMILETSESQSVELQSLTSKFLLNQARAGFLKSLLCGCMCMCVCVCLCICVFIPEAMNN